jgi:hypothetical protein
MGRLITHLIVCAEETTKSKAYKKNCKNPKSKITIGLPTLKHTKPLKSFIHETNPNQGPGSLPHHHNIIDGKKAQPGNKQHQLLYG